MKREIKHRVPRYLKTTLIVLIIAVVAIAGVKSWLFNEVRVFKINVLPETSETIQEVEYFKDYDAMHGPLLFAFRASQKDIQLIIQHNKLEKPKQISEKALMLLTHIDDSHEIPWWRPLKELSKMECYAREVPRSQYDTILVIIFIESGNKVYYLKG